jgi:hypothetical protein
VETLAAIQLKCKMVSFYSGLLQSFKSPIKIKGRLRNCRESSVSHVPTFACSTISLPGKSNLVRQSLYETNERKETLNRMLLNAFNNCSSWMAGSPPRLWPMVRLFLPSARFWYHSTTTFCLSSHDLLAIFSRRMLV